VRHVSFYTKKKGKYLEVALNLVEDVLGGTAEEKGARLGLLALDDERVVLVANLLDVEESALGTDVGLLELLRSVDDGGAASASNAVSVALAGTAKGGDVGLDKVVLGEVCGESVSLNVCCLWKKKKNI